MIAHLQRIVDRVVNRLQARLTDDETDRILEALRESEGITCRVCGEGGDFEVSGTLNGVLKHDFLCADDLGVFITTFSPAIRELTVVRL